MPKPIVLLHGPRGIGKTSLHRLLPNGPHLAAYVDFASDEEWRVLCNCPKENQRRPRWWERDSGRGMEKLREKRRVRVGPSMFWIGIGMRPSSPLTPARQKCKAVDASLDADGNDGFTIEVERADAVEEELGTAAESEGSEMSAEMRGMGGGGEGATAQARDWASLEGLRLARARVLRGEFGVPRNLRDSRMMYFSVKLEAPRITSIFR